METTLNGARHLFFFFNGCRSKLLKRHETTINFISFSKMKKRKTDFLVFHCGRGKKKGYLIASLCFIISDRLHENRTITVSLLFVLVSRYFKVEKKKRTERKRHTHTDRTLTQWVRWLLCFFLLVTARVPLTGIKKRVIKEQRTMDALRLLIFINSSKGAKKERVDV